MHEFISAMKRLGEVKPEEIFPLVFQLYNQISHMDKETVVAAWQAFLAFERTTGLYSHMDKNLDSIKDGLISRMLMLISEEKTNDDKRRLMLGFRQTDTPPVGFLSVWLNAKDLRI